MRKRSLLHYAVAALGVLAVLAVLALVVVMLMLHQKALAISTLGALALGFLLYLSPRFYAWRYVFPGVLAAVVFIVLPMAYTFSISFTNYSSAHLLTLERSREVLLGQMDSQGNGMQAQVIPREGAFQLLMTADDGAQYHSALFALGEPVRLPLVAGVVEADAALGFKDLLQHKDALEKVVAVLPDGQELRMSSLRRFVSMKPKFQINADGSLTELASQQVLSANLRTGFWTRVDGSTVEPGFRAVVGLQNYVQIFTEEKFLDPFLRVFAWTFSFATLNTLFTFGLGIVLATLLSWDALRHRNFYRIMLFLPYAVPAFISIPVFRGLFNENLGEINAVLDALFGIRPGWFSEAGLARSMVLIVNAWLGYPYMMILCMGLIKAIPSELYEASALAGAGPLTNFFRITLPLIAKPIAPLLVASFATNFNNLTLIALLTGGAPDYLDTMVPVGATDLLASYTYRIAFQDSGQNYALACAISSLVFVLVGTLAVINLKLFKVGKEGR
ncbi:maltose ABC transporter permease MalF [Curvibacter sp. CHRR-16]|uniref:maltose ABC transporter permease MalF n=1 Tax=Curvibacter sp. CHRR-16 TaxID=2835872 RepID=UPI001BD96232|nr:maltose ABC transporter permease MalF [Curvibacter sp. CHRR-16]